VRSFTLNNNNSGLHQIDFDGKDKNGNPLASGVYTVRLKTRDQVMTRRITLIK